MATMEGEQETISARLEAYQPLRSVRYAAVDVLLLSWKDDDIGCAAEIDELAELFCGECFGYNVFKYRIPSEDSQAQLNFRIAQFILSSGRDENLLIVYYGGHSMRVKDRSPCTWVA